MMMIGLCYVLMHVLFDLFGILTGWIISRGGELCCTERCLSIPGWEFGGDVSEHLPPWLQLPWGLLSRCESSCQGLCLPAAAGRAGATALCSILPAGSLAPSSRCDKQRSSICHIKSHAATTVASFSESHLSSGHLQTHFLYRETETPEWCSGHRHDKGLPSQPPAQPYLTGLNVANRKLQLLKWIPFFFAACDNM